MSGRLQHKIEVARCAAVDIYARASAKVTEQVKELRVRAERLTHTERQLQECKDLLKIRCV